MTVHFLGDLRKPRTDPYRYGIELAEQCGTLAAALKCLLQSPTNEPLRELCQTALDDFEAWRAANKDAR